jgi:hypothetical protein
MGIGYDIPRCKGRAWGHWSAARTHRAGTQGTQHPSDPNRSLDGFWAWENSSRSGFWMIWGNYFSWSLLECCWDHDWCHCGFWMILVSTSCNQSLISTELQIGHKDSLGHPARSRTPQLLTDLTADMAGKRAICAAERSELAWILLGASPHGWEVVNNHSEFTVHILPVMVTYDHPG